MSCHPEHTIRMKKKAWIVANRFNECFADTDDYLQACSLAKTMSGKHDYPIHGEILTVISNRGYFNL